MTIYPQRHPVMAKATPTPVSIRPKQQSKVFHTYPCNDKGRDFVLGDIHGAFDLVLQGMKQVNFDSKFDRIFSVGDLVDRGPQSYRADEFLRKSYVHATRGNHDDDISSLTLDEMRVLGEANWNGMGWIKSVTDEKLLSIKAQFADLPVAIQVETKRGTVGLVHADVPSGMHWDIFIDALKRGDPNVMKVALWGRDRIKSNDQSGVAGIGRLFVGHSIQWGGAKRMGNVYAIDTGAVFQEIDGDRGALTMVNMVCHTGVIGPIVDEALRRAVETHELAGIGPFGNYVLDTPAESGERPSFPRG